jgi:hypothetical protein
MDRLFQNDLRSVHVLVGLVSNLCVDDNVLARNEPGLGQVERARDGTAGAAKTAESLLVGHRRLFLVSHFHVRPTHHIEGNHCLVVERHTSINYGLQCVPGVYKG